MTAIIIRRAQEADAAAIVALRDDAARWLLGRGIEQWQPGEVSTDDIGGWLLTGRVYLAERAGTPVGSVRLAWDDAEVWGAQPPEAGYLHALVIARQVSGERLGGRLLSHVEEVIRRSGRPLARLDHVAGSAGLAAYYEQAGYVAVGRRDFPDDGWHSVTLREKRLS